MRDHAWGLTQDLLRSLLRYEPETGNFIRIVGRKGVAAGAIAGWKLDTGYISISIRIDGKDRHFRAHRLVWFYMTSVWPSADVEHRDTDRTNNRWSNLREATRSQNLQNMSPRGGSSKFKGVCYDKKRKSWEAYVGTGKTRVRLGRFKEEIDAARAYDTKAQELYGEFARLNFPAGASA